MRVILFLLVVVLLSSCTTTNLFISPKSERKIPMTSQDSAFWFQTDYQHRIRQGDKVNISVWGQDELSVGSVYGIYNSNEVYGKWLLVDENGNIEVPKLGTMKVLDWSVPEIKDTLKKRFAKWVVTPIVDVKILNKEITVMGEVRNPQVFLTHKDQNNLLEFITRCGGFEDYANVKDVKVLRQDGEDVRVATLDLSRSGDYRFKNIQLHPGDIIIVPTKRYKMFDKRVSTIIPFTSTATAAAILMGIF